MKKTYLLIALAIISFAKTQAQTQITPSEYDKLKKSGSLNPSERYIFTKESNSLNAAKTPPPLFHVDSAQAGCSCLVPFDNGFSVVPFSGYNPPDYRNDDASSNAIILPFDFMWHGIGYSSLYINNNGNVSFGTAFSTYDPTGFPSSSYVMLAPFWADVDTRNTSSGLVYFKMDSHKLVVLWDHVGYYSQYIDKLNTFQLILTDGTDSILPNGYNVGFCYGDMQWTTGDASGGTNGFGGTASTVGVNLGDSVNYSQITRNDTSGYTYDGPYDNNDGVDWLDNRSFYFDVSNVNGVAPIAYDTICDSIIPVADSSFFGFRFFINPMDANDSITYTLDSVPAGITVTEFPTSNARGFNVTVSPAYAGGERLYVSFSDQKSDGVVHHYSKGIEVVPGTSTGIKSNQFVENSFVYPNPTSGKITVPLNSTRISVYDITGRNVHEQLVSDQKNIDISSLRNGVYYLVLTDNNGKQVTCKLLKQ